MSQQYHSQQLREAILTHTKICLQRKYFFIISYSMSLNIKSFCDITISKCSEKIFDLARQVFEKFKLFWNLRFMERWKLFSFITAYLMLVWQMTFTLLAIRGYLEVKSWWYKKTVLYLVGDVNLFKIWGKNKFFVRPHFSL